MKLPSHITPPPRRRPTTVHDRTPVYAIVGNPNCGKTTLFNALTGLRQKVGNYPGVTVEKKMGTTWSQHGRPIQIIDLPGAYSLAARSPDEAVLRDVLLGRRADTPQPDRIICVVDAANLERNLYLVHQILDLGRPVIIALNMMDMASSAGLKVDPAELEGALGIPVIACEAVRGRGLVELKVAMSRVELPLARHRWDVPAPIAPAVAELQASLSDADQRSPLVARAEALLLLTDFDTVRVAGSTPLSPRTHEILDQWRRRWTAEGADWSAALIRTRYDAIRELCRNVIVRPGTMGPSLSDRIDAVLCHSVGGWAVFAVIMAALFYSIFSLAEAPMDFIDGQVAALGDWVKGAMAAGDLRDLLTDGIIGGVGGVVIFLPQILILFFFVGLLESTGYMARAAFIMDRPMSKVGLNGRSFIPLLGSYACAIPGIMATRTIENAKDRLVTILVAPLMSCSARLPVYLLMIAMLLPDDTMSAGLKTGIMLLMYALGTTGVFFFAWLFKRTLVRGAPQHMIMELPAYQPPRFKDILRHMVERGWLFLKNAGTIILAISIVLWALTTYPKHPNPAATSTEQIAHSFAGRAGHLLEPVIQPLGFDWRIGIGLITSFAAREVFVSSMGVIFGVEGAEDDTTPLRDALRGARWPDGAPLFTPLVCLTLMVFYVFAMQCMATLAVVKRETNSWRWPLFQIFYLTGTAWVLCLILYQTGRALGY
ncbi:Ferrous iron transport protein B [Lacunisphaera limnophila]|uniref:Ferrous iron transport protein B n=1 Tax=Lacunisphaera limnophila TaxID=1838286 RepID=A0A1D8AT03_9BACT|nr:ferrous iron transport protein B [Lacunisphaera limnophila]AOS43990.1 Ferrous iron transport protein B [Lacunisphaera limnophila]